MTRLLHIPRWLMAALAFLLVVLTYPAFEPDFGVGLDSSYVWGFNYLFDNDYQTLTQLVHPYGPFSCLRLPLVGNGHYAIFLIFFSLTKFAFAWMALMMACRRKQPLWLTLAALVPACLYANIDVLLVANVALLVMAAIEKKSFWRFLVAAAIAVFSLSIKSSIGTSSCAVLFVGWLVLAFRHKDWKFTVITAASVPVMFLVVGLAVWHSFPVMWHAWVGVLNLVGGYSEAVLMPEHEGWSLLAFAVALLAFALTLKGQWARCLALLLLIPLFSFWRYGITREDVFHFNQFISSVVCFLILIALAQNRFCWLPWLSGIAAFLFLLVNFSALNTIGAKSLSAGPQNLVGRVVCPKQLVDESWGYIANTLSSRKLDDSLCAVVGNASVDCYPWEHVYIPANKFSWQPHTSVELASGNSLWLNHQSALNFSSHTDAVSFVILHKVNYGCDDGLRSLDGRYLLSDEPAIIDSLFTNYTLVDSGGWYGLLLRHGDGRFSPASEPVAELTVAWNEWVPLPPHPDSSILRAEVFSQPSFLGWVKGLLYKPDIYYVDYRLPNGEVVSYRYSRTTAVSGLWMGPLLQSYADLATFLSGCPASYLPVAIRFRTASMNDGDRPLRLQNPELTIRFRRALVL